MRIKLRVIQGALKSPDGRSLGAEIPILRRRFVIGTAPDCHMRCSGQSISPHHCVILVEDDRVVVRDDASQGGTFLNGARIDTSACLFHGDRLRVGKLEFDVVVSSSSPPSDPLPPPIALPQSQRDTLAAGTDTIADLVVGLLLSSKKADRERRRFDHASRELHPATEVLSTPEMGAPKPVATAKSPVKPPPLAKLLTPAARKKSG